MRSLPDEAARRQLEELLDARRQLAILLLAPADPADKDRGQRLEELTRRKEKLERDLVQRIPTLARRQALELAPYTELVKRLPNQAVFLDFLRYSRWDAKQQRLGKPHYVAFVLRAGQPVRRIELGPAQLIEDAIEQWQRDIRRNEVGIAAERLNRLLWEPLVKHLPDTPNSTVYIAPDGVLSTLPWAALPGRKPGTVLLEDHALAVVPHGPFLLELLTPDPTARPRTGNLLVLGGVAYDQEPSRLEAADRAPILRSPDVGKGRLSWDALPGTARELAHIRALAEKQSPSARIVERSRTGASTLQLLRDLPAARWAHLATHGFFAAPRTDERKALLDDRFFAFGRFGERRGVGARNPLVQSGLVLAGANLPPGADILRDDRGILTGEAIAGLDLDGLEVAVLSACETGLGEASGEGVFGLQRAFHMGGCRNVVASLWKVDDEATLALMALFYQQLWEAKLPPLEALRRAQLALYRHPDAIPQLAKERGPNFDKVVQRVVTPSTDPKEPRPKGPAPVKQWAAFVLSGLGR